MNEVQLVESDKFLESPFVQRFVDFAQGLSKAAAEVLELEGIGWGESMFYNDAVAREKVIHLDDTTHLRIFQECNINDEIPFLTQIAVYQGIAKKNLNDDSRAKMSIEVHMDGLDHPERKSAKDSYCQVLEEGGNVVNYNLSLAPEITQAAANYFKHYEVILQAYKNRLLEQRTKSRSLVE